MLELSLQARRGNFQLRVDCTLAASWTVLFGPSGAGKSTVLRLIAGLEAPDSGRIQLDGQILTDTASRRFLSPGMRKIGMVAQQPALFPHLTVAENVAYGLSHFDRKSCMEGSQVVLELVQAPQLAHRWPRDLSGGEAQRIALARALAPMPRLLLLDEPLSALDAAARDQVLARLQPWLAEHRIQTLVVTHDAADALATAAEVAVLHQGTLTAVGPAAEVLALERARLLRRLGQNPDSPKSQPDV